MQNNLENKKKNRKLLIVLVSGLLSCLMLSLAVFAGYMFLRTPLGDPLSLVRQTPTPTPEFPAGPSMLKTATPASADLSTNQQPTVTQPTVVSAQSVKRGMCGSTGTLTVLFTGSDVTGGVEPRGADAIRLVKVDFDRQKMVVVAFPRDLWVSTPALADLKIDQTRLGLAYYSMKEATSGSDKHRITVATTLLAQTLYDNFAVEPQDYFTLEMKSVSDMISAVGGVEVDVPQAFVSDYKMSFSAGPQLLDGPRAAEFVRTFAPGGDAARLQRQNLFLKGLQARVISADILPKLPDLLKQFDKVMFTDLNPQQLASLGCMAREVPQEQIFFHEIGADLVTQGSKGILIPNVDKIKAKLQEWLAD